MADDEYTEDLTELAIDRILSDPDDTSTDPMMRVEPEVLRAHEQDGIADQMLVRSVLNEAALLDSGDVDATQQNNVYDDEEATNLHIALDRSRLNPQPSSPAQLPSPRRPNPTTRPGASPTSSNLPRRSQTTSGLVKKPRLPQKSVTPKPPSSPAPAVWPPRRVERNAAPPAHLGDHEEPPDTNDQLRRLGLTRGKQANANHVRGHSGFYSLPEANVVDVTGEHKALDARHRDALGLGVALTFGLLSGLGILTAAISRWMDPSRMMAITLLLMVVSCGVVAALVVPRGQTLRLTGLRRAYLPMSYAAALPLIAALAWQLGFVRTELRQFAPATAEMTGRVLQDRSDGVALSECIAIAPRYEYVEWRMPLVTALAGRPGLSAACLERLEPKTATAFGGTLADRWHRELLAGDLDGERACDIADSLAELEQPTGEVETRLLTCLLVAPNTDTKKCCSGALARLARKSPTWTEDVQRQDGYIADEQTAADFLALAFHPASAPPEDVEMFKAAKLNGPEGQVLALALACDALRAGGTDLGRRLGVSAGEECQVNLGTLSTSREVWLEVCEEAEARLEQGGELPTEVLCSATQRSLTRLAVADASRIVGSAAKNRTAERKLAFAIDVEGETNRDSEYKRQVDARMKRFRKIRKDGTAAGKSTFGRSW